MKESGEARLKWAIYESTLSTAGAVPLPRWGRQRGGGSAAKKKANPASLRPSPLPRGRGSRGYSLLPLEGGAPKGRRLDGDSGIPAPKPSPRGEGAPKGRIGQERYEKERGRSSQVDDKRKHPIHRCAVPLPQWGRQRGGGFAAKKEANPASLRPSPLPREGARVDTPSFLWKEVPRRGGGWMGIAVFPHQSLPLEGKVPRRGG